MCSLCESPDFRVFTAEMNIHFPGRENLDTPTVLAFPPVTICVNCGCGEFAVHGDPLRKLKAVLNRRLPNPASAEPTKSQE
jgi:hypothetical protein